MITIFTAVNKTDYSVHFFDSIEAISLARTMDARSWKHSGSFKLKEGSVVCGLHVKTKKWVENEYTFTDT